MYEIQLISGSLYSIRIFLALQFLFLSGIRPFSTISAATLTEAQPHEDEYSTTSSKAINLVFLIIGILATIKRSWKS